MNITNKHTRFNDLVRYIAFQIPGIKTVQLVKTIYFLELEYLIKFGEHLTEVPIIRLDMGPVSSGYKQRFKKLIEQGIISSKKIGKGIAYYSSNTSIFEEIETAIFKPKISFIKNIIKSKPNQATEIIKGLSYQTLPMQRFVEREAKDNQIHIGWKVLNPPFFTEKDVDLLARERRALRDHLKKAKPFTAEDALIGFEVYNDMAPLLKITNEVALNS
jgi:hypothetical protein